MSMIERCAFCDSALSPYSDYCPSCSDCNVFSEDDIRRHARINSTLAPKPHLPLWEAGVMMLAAAFIGFILVAL